MMDGRVKTLHPRIHGGILCLRENHDHLGQAEREDVELIDLVAVNLYPFEITVSKEGVMLEEAIEMHNKLFYFLMLILYLQNAQLHHHLNRYILYQVDHYDNSK